MKERWEREVERGTSVNTAYTANATNNVFGINARKNTTQKLKCCTNRSFTAQIPTVELAIYFLCS